MVFWLWMSLSNVSLILRGGLNTIHPWASCVHATARAVLVLQTFTLIFKMCWKVIDKCKVTGDAVAMMLQISFPVENNSKPK